MGSKVSTAKRSTPPKTKAVTAPVISRDTIPVIPHDIINEILDHLAGDSAFRSIRACALLSKSWVQPCRYHLFHTALFTPASAREWLKTFPIREESPAHYVKDLRLRMGHGPRLPEEFFECIPWFTEVDRMSFLGYGAAPLGYRTSPSPGPSFWRPPRSVTSLTISTAVVTLVQVRDIVAQLPNLNDLVLSGFDEPKRSKLLGIGTVLKGRFGGRLMLSDECVSEGVINMLLEIPSGLHFTEMKIHCTQNPLPSSAVRLAEACGETLVRLSHTVSFHDPNLNDTVERSFDFSKFPNVQEVTFGFTADWRGGGLPWIPMALSTLRPATSPHLSVIRLDFASSAVYAYAMIAAMGDDLRRIAGEVARIEREFEGAVNFTVLRDPRVQTVLATLNVLQHIH